MRGLPQHLSEFGSIFSSVLNWIRMAQYTSTQPRVTGLRRFVCTTFVLGDENRCNANSNEIVKWELATARQSKKGVK